MTGFLLDTNVVSELTRDRPDPRVVAFLSAQPDLWLSTLVLHELEYGLELLPAGSRREGLDGHFAAGHAPARQRLVGGHLHQRRMYSRRTYSVIQ